MLRVLLRNISTEVGIVRNVWAKFCMLASSRVVYAQQVVLKCLSTRETLSAFTLSKRDHSFTRCGPKRSP